MTKWYLFEPDHPVQIMTGAIPRATETSDDTYVYSPDIGLWQQPIDNNNKFSSREMSPRVWRAVPERDVPKEYIMATMLLT